MINLKYENFNPQIHDTHKVATYVYDVDFRTFDLLFKDKTLRDIASYALTFSNYGYMGNAIMLAVFPAIFFEYTIFTLPFTLLLYLWGVPVLLLKNKENPKLNPNAEFIKEVTHVKKII